MIRLDPALSGLLAAARQRGLPSALHSLYDQLPPTDCARRGRCCGLLPPAAPVEVLAWLLMGQNTPARNRALAAARLVRHFLLNAAQRRPCPWARPGACRVYPERFFGCRAYGLWSRESYDRRQGPALAAQEAVARAWAGLGVKLPARVLAPPPPYCDRVRAQNQVVVDDEALDGMEERLYALSEGLPALEAVTAWGGDLSYAAAALTLGPQECLQAKVAITRALCDGREGQARGLLRRALRRAVAAVLTD